MASPYAIKKIISKTFSGCFMLPLLPFRKTGIYDTS